VAERLQKWLATKGFGSRREIERWIVDGRIKVNGETAVLGVKVDGTEKIVVNGKAVRIEAREARQRTLIYHKPPGEICSRSDPQGRRTIFKSLPKVLGQRWVSVGRLDYQTTGLILVTTDGELANKLMHPSSELEREYVVRAFGELSQDQLAELRKGVQLEDGEAKFDSIELSSGEGSGAGANRSYVVTVREGRNRIVRRLFESVGCRVNRLMRVRYGAVSLPRDLRPGKHRELSEDEVKRLFAV
jgi:23S rRNA pseudouridine2605 synthase